MWVDASTLAYGVVLTVGGQSVEDACWLRSDVETHINLAELDAAVRGLNTAVKWGLKKVTLMTDSSTVARWLHDALEGKSRLRTKAMSEMLVKRRVSTFTTVAAEYQMKVCVELVKSADNLADILTRVPERWLTVDRAVSANEEVCAAMSAPLLMPTQEQLSDLHHRVGHPGIRRTLFFAKRQFPAVTRARVADVVKNCDVCRSIDPASVRWPKGHLDVNVSWSRLAIDVTHVGHMKFLTVIDCGPSRFSLWRQLQREDAKCMAEHLEQIFLERGAPEEILLDNATAFRSAVFSTFLTRWGVRTLFRCAYYPAGNSIVERCHRTVKCIAARSRCSISDAVYFYNVTPKDDVDEISSPANMIYNYSIRIRGVDSVAYIGPTDDSANRFKVGDTVWVRPVASRCNVQYDRGIVTNVLSPQAVEIDGVPRHVKDVRMRARDDVVPDRADTLPPSASGGNGQADTDGLYLRAVVDEASVQSEPELVLPHGSATCDEPVALRRSERLRQKRECEPGLSDQQIMGECVRDSVDSRGLQVGQSYGAVECGSGDRESAGGELTTAT